MRARIRSWLLCICLPLLGCVTLTAQSYEWAFRAGADITPSAINSVQTDKDGFVYTLGRYADTLVDVDPTIATSNLATNGLNDIFLGKYDDLGNLVWAFGVGDTANDVGKDLAIDTANNIYITGYFEGNPDFDPSAGSQTIAGVASGDIFLAKYNDAGNLLFANAMAGQGTNRSNGITLDRDNNIYITGLFSNTVDFDPGPGSAPKTAAAAADAFVAKYDALGNYIWAIALGKAGASCEGFDLVVDTLGNVYVTGSFSGQVDFNPGAGTNTLTAAGSKDAFVAKYTPAGAYVWAFKIGAGNLDEGFGIALKDNLLYVTGYFTGTADFDPSGGTANRSTVGTNTDMFLASYNTAKIFQWAKDVGGVGNTRGTGLIQDMGTDLWVTGYFTGMSDFDPNAGTQNRTATAGNDFYLAKYSALGAYISAENMGSAGNSYGNAIALYGPNTLYAVGFFDGTEDFNPDSDTNELSTPDTLDFDLFLAKYKICTKPIEASLSNADRFVCVGDTIDLTAEGLLNSATNWYWYLDSCGGVPIDSGATIQITDTVLEYWVRSEGGCTGLGMCDSILTGINQLPSVSLSGLDTNYCTYDTIYALAGLPGGGTFSGPGVVASTFDVNLAGSGTHDVIYTYTDGNGCVGSALFSTSVHSSYTTFTGLDSGYCDNEAADSLTGIPAGGIFSGPGLTGSWFSPVGIGLGIKSIAYVVTDTNGCTFSDTQQTFISTLPIPSISGLAGPYCANEQEIPVTGSPSGGIFTGAGMTDTIFRPGDTIGGTYAIIYNYTNQYGCFNQAFRLVTVWDLPVVSLTPLDSASYCREDSMVYYLSASPFGGTFAGAGVVDSTWYPPGAGIGNHFISYTYTDGNGCVGQDTFTINVRQCIFPPPPDTNTVDTTDVMVHELGLTEVVEVYPNPSDGQFTVVLPHSQSGTMRVISTNGQLVAEQSVLGTRTQLDLRGNARGIYQLLLTTDKGVLSRRLVLQ